MLENTSGGDFLCTYQNSGNQNYPFGVAANKTFKLSNFDCRILKEIVDLKILNPKKIGQNR